MGAFDDLVSQSGAMKTGSFDDLVPKRTSLSEMAAKNAPIDKTAPVGEEGFVGGLADIGRGLAHGVTAGAPQQIGKALQWFGAEDTGKALEEYGKQREEANPEFKQSQVGQAANQTPLSIRGGAYAGGENAPLSYGPMLAGMGLGAAVAGPVGVPIGAIAGSLASLPIFYGSQAKESADKVEKAQLEQGATPLAARSAANTAGHLSGAIEAGGELVGDVIPWLKLPGAKQASAALTKAAAGGVIKSVLGSGWKEAGKTLAKTEAGEILTEMGQQAGEAAVEGAYGAGPGATWQDTASVVVPTAIMSLIPGGVAGTHAYRNVSRLHTALTDPKVDTTERADAALETFHRLDAVDPNLAQAWDRYAADMIAGGQAIDIGSDQTALNYVAQDTAQAQAQQTQAAVPPAPPLALPAPAARAMADRSGDIPNEEQRTAAAALQARVDALYAARAAEEQRQQALMGEKPLDPAGGPMQRIGALAQAAGATPGTQATNQQPAGLAARAQPQGNPNAVQVASAAAVGAHPGGNEVAGRGQEGGGVGQGNELQQPPGVRQSGQGLAGIPSAKAAPIQGPAAPVQGQATAAVPEGQGAAVAPSGHFTPGNPLAKPLANPVGTPASQVGTPASQVGTQVGTPASQVGTPTTSEQLNGTQAPEAQQGEAQGSERQQAPSAGVASRYPVRAISGQRIGSEVGPGQFLVRTGIKTERTAKDIARTAAAEKDQQAAGDAADAVRRQAHGREEVRQRSEAAADTFELGQDAEENLTGQKDIFSQPKAKSVETEGASPQSAGQLPTPRAPHLSRLNPVAAAVHEVARVAPDLVQAVQRGIVAGRIVIENNVDGIVQRYAQNEGLTEVQARAQLGITEQSTGDDINGFYHNGRAYFVSEKLKRGQLLGVLHHESTHGREREALNQRALALIESRNDGSHTPAMKSLLDTVAERMTMAGEVGNVREAMPYLVEEAAKVGRFNGSSRVDNRFLMVVDRISKPLGNLIRDVVASLRATGLKAGLDLKPTVDDLMVVARGNVKEFGTKGALPRGDGAQKSVGEGVGGSGGEVAPQWSRQEIAVEQRQAEAYATEHGMLPYVTDPDLAIPLDTPLFSIKAPYSDKEIAKGKLGNHPLFNLPLNQNGTVSLYFPTTNEMARQIAKDKMLRPASGARRIYLTNESSGPTVMQAAGNIQQPMDGANVLVQIDPGLLHLDQEHSNGRKDFFIAVREGKAFDRKLVKMTKLFTLNKSRRDAISQATTIADIGQGITAGLERYRALSATERKAALKQAKAVLREEHNVGTLLTANAKLEKTNSGNYGLTYDGLSVDSMGLGLASAQAINERNLNSCPMRAICEGLYLGETSGQNLLYGGDGQYRSGPRLSQYLKTEALVMHPAEFAIVLHAEIEALERWDAVKQRPAKQDKSGKVTAYSPEGYQSAVRLNVTSDFPAKMFKALIDAHPNVMFYDYTKLDQKPIADNHYFTYSSTGASQVVNGKRIDNPHSNWLRMVRLLNAGKNVAMAFSNRDQIPQFVRDAASGKVFKVLDGDTYDARFLDPQTDLYKNNGGTGLIVGLTNKDRTTSPEMAAEKHQGFFIHYDPAVDGDTVTIMEQATPIKPQFSRAAHDRAIKQGYITESRWEEVVNGVRHRELAKEDGANQVDRGVEGADRGDTGRLQRFFHGTSDDIRPGFDLEHPNRKDAGWLGKGVYVTDDPDHAYGYARQKRGSAGQNILPLAVRVTSPYHASMAEKKKLSRLSAADIQRATDRLIAHGYDSVLLRHPNGTNELVVLDPKNVRSYHAEFKDGESTDLLFSRQTETPEFRKWFGNSKVVDKDGKPLVVYHGTQKAGFTVFYLNQHFGTNAQANDMLDYKRRERERLMSRPGKKGERARQYIESGGSYEFGTSDAVYPVYLAIQNPMRIADQGSLWEWDQAIRKAKELGHDGIVYHNDYEGNGEDGGDSYIAFYPEQIKSATGNNGAFDAKNPDIRFSRGPVWRSALREAISGAKQESMPGKQWAMWLTGNASKLGVKADEMQWSGITDWLALQQGKVTKADIDAYLAQNGVKVEETMLGESGAAKFWIVDNSGEKVDNGDFDRREDAEQALRELEQNLGWDGLGVEEVRAEEGGTKYANYQTPGGENYRELLLTLPAKRVWLNGDPVTEEDLSTQHGRDAADRVALYVSEFQSSHFDQPNILGHVRFNDRTDADGNKVLFVQELQSDWAQKGRKDGFANDVAAGEVFDQGNGRWGVRWPDGTYSGGFSREGAERAAPMGKRGSVIPNAPFVTDTKAWVALLLKRMIRYAAENGYDKIAFATGQQNADLYDLSKQVSRVVWNETNGALYAQRADYGGIRDDRESIKQNGVTRDKLPDIIGKEAAERMLAAKDINGWRTLEGGGLKVGGEGMRSFYDKIVPQVANDVLKKLGGGKVGAVDIGNFRQSAFTGEKTDEFDVEHAGHPAITITPELRDKALGGMPLFSRQASDITTMDRLQRLVRDGSGGQPVFLRFAKDIEGDLRGRRSTNWVTKEHEAGLSVVPLSPDEMGMYLPADESAPPDAPQNLGGAIGNYIDYMDFRGADGGYLVTGEVQGYGSDGEPLLKNAQLIGRVRNEVLFDAYQAWADSTGDAGLKTRVAEKIARLAEAKPEFSRAPRGLSGLTRAQTAAAAKLGVNLNPVSLKDRLKQLSSNATLKIESGLFDAFAVLKHYGEKAYALASLTKSDSAILESTLKHGIPYLTDAGSVRVRADAGGFIGKLQDLQGEHKRFFLWVAANRAERLMAEGREHNLEANEIAELKQLNAGAMNDGRQRSTVYETALRAMERYNQAMLDLAEKAGVIEGTHYVVVDAQGTVLDDVTQLAQAKMLAKTHNATIETRGRAMWEGEFYVPFYRNMEDGVYKGPTKRKGLANQTGIQRLKGGAEATNDLLSNVLHNWSHLIGAALRNQAASHTLAQAEAAGVAAAIPEAASGKGDVYVLKDGRKQYYRVEDPFTLQAISAMAPSPLTGVAATVMGKFKHALTLGVTISPSFRIRNLIRDSLHSVATANVSANVAQNIKQGYLMLDPKADVYQQMLAGGALMHFGDALEGNSAAHTDRLINAGIKDSTVLDTKEKVRDAFQRAWDWWEQTGSKAENVNRATAYQQEYERRLAAGASEDEAHLYASLEARKMMDFSQQGHWQAVRFLAQVVPFFNARLVGMHRLGTQGVGPTARVLKGTASAQDKAKALRFNATLGAISLAGMALLLAYRDDDDWKRREEWDRDQYWAFKVGNVMYRIPKPFELGAMATLAERGLETMLDGMTPEAQKRFVDRFWSILGDNLSLNPIPQVAKPVVDLYANKDSFTQREIETRGLENLSKANRIKPNTSAVAQALGNPVLSPVQIDHLIQGYFGWLGSHTVMAADMMLRPALNLPTKPERKLGDYMVIGDFAKDLPSNQSRYLTEFYDQLQATGEAYADYRQALKLGQTDKARAIATEKRKELGLHQMYAQQGRMLSELNAQIRRVEASAMTAADKRATIDALNQRKLKVAEQAAAVRATTAARP